MQVGFHVANFSVGSVGSLFRSMRVASESLDAAILVHTRFSLRDSNIKGCLGIILGVTSAERLFQAVDEWAEGRL